VRFFPVASEVVGTPSFEVAIESALLEAVQETPQMPVQGEVLELAAGPAHHRCRNYEPEAHAN
jgi:ribosomal protein S12 methylthiotransferase accessory factor YcaO